MRRGISKLKELHEQSTPVVKTPPTGEKAELPIFYVNKALQSAELRYSPLEQLALALLREFDIQFKPRPTEKGQAVTDFISELTPPITLVLADSCIDAEETGVPSAICFDPSIPVWILHVDDSANQQGCGAGLVLTAPDRVKMEYALRFSFRTSNNEAEYEALLAGLRLAKSMGARQISIHSDSQLIVNQVIADFAAKDVSISAYPLSTHQLLQKFLTYKIQQTSLASAIDDKVGRQVPVEILTHPSTTTVDVCAMQYEDTWMSPIHAYVTNATLPNDKAQARKLRYRSAIPRLT
ncbi:unnamed protein product [Prunus armeniaca]